MPRNGIYNAHDKETYFRFLCSIKYSRTPKQTDDDVFASTPLTGPYQQHHTCEPAIQQAPALRARCVCVITINTVRGSACVCVYLCRYVLCCCAYARQRAIQISRRKPTSATHNPARIARARAGVKSVLLLAL